MEAMETMRAMEAERRNRVAEAFKAYLWGGDGSEAAIGKMAVASGMGILVAGVYLDLFGLYVAYHWTRKIDGWRGKETARATWPGARYGAGVKSRPRHRPRGLPARSGKDGPYRSTWNGGN